MELHLLVAAPRPIFCKGLSNLFVGNPNIASIEEAITGEELNRKLGDNLINFVIAHRSLITDISLLPRGQFVLLTAKPDKELFLAALQHGIRGYLLDDASEDLLKKILDIAPGACIFDLALASWVTSLFVERNELLPVEDSGLLTTREREVLELKKQRFSNREIADKLCIEVNTVKKFVQHIRSKLPEVSW